jgi:hypothetical protein
MLLFFLGFVALVIAAKWAIGRFMFRLQRERLALFTCTPILYLPGIPAVLFLIQGISENFGEVFYDANGDSHVVLGFNIVFLTAFVVAFAAMLILDGLLIKRHVAAESGRVFRTTRWDSGLERAAGWAATIGVNLVMWFSWMVVYYAI